MGEQTVSAWNVDFRELYERHLCRHSQFGNNVVHVACLVGIYFGLYGIVSSGLGLLPWLGRVESGFILVALAVPYVVLLVRNVPVRVWLVTVIFLAAFFAAFLALPKLAIWWYLAAVVVFYKLQSWTHRLFTKEHDMTEFDKKYQKGSWLFLVLSLYELPILLNYLIFGRKDWCA
jgi:hypothetical protein